jgi:hypothetical protein
LAGVVLVAGSVPVGALVWLGQRFESAGSAPPELGLSLADLNLPRDPSFVPSPSDGSAPFLVRHRGAGLPPSDGPAPSFVREPRSGPRPSPGFGPSLVLVGDPGCPACVRVKEDFELDPWPFGVGVGLAIVERSELSGEALDSLGPGLFPVFLLFDADGRLLDHRRGYRSPRRLQRWVESRIEEAASGAARP